jgi:TonB-dependent SusC/RagA subfamily outer membrane receptor
VGSVFSPQQPLIVVDGIIGGSYNPNDIESVSVLKDAGATGLYGSAAAAGVILIKTKIGTPGKSEIRAQIRRGIKTPEFGNYQLMNTPELYAYHESLFSPALFKTARPDSLLKYDFDWVNNTYRQANITTVNLSALGGTEKLNYYLSVDYMDDEGTSTGRTVLIERGMLRGYITDKLNARLMGIPLTGNGRRESYQSVVLPRMTNTFMLAGTSDPEEIIRSVDRGLYAVSFGGGQVDITNGKFVFSASEAYLIEGGKVTRPVKGATLIGSGPEILTKVSMVGHDLKLDEGIGTCGKEGQSVPVGVGLPTIRIDEITVGGTQR